MLLRLSTIRRKWRQLITISSRGLLAIFFIADIILLIIYFQKADLNKLIKDSGFFDIFHRNNSSFVQVIHKSEINSETTSGGVSWRDYNGDGYLDLLLPAQDSRYKLYRNNHNETFTDVTEEAGLSLVPQFGAAAVFGDYDNDGCPDLYLSTHGPLLRTITPGNHDLLYHNNCDGTFSDVTTQAGIADHSHGWGVAWADYDRDGFLDIYVANWGVVKNRLEWSIESNILYHNNGDGTFTNVTDKAGVMGLAKCKVVNPFPRFSKKENRLTEHYRLTPWKLNWQPIWFDYNNDGFPDLYVTHDDGVSILYKNNGNGTFTDTTEEAYLCHVGSGMGVAAGDYDGDEDLDLYVTHTDRNLLWQNNGDGTFTEVSEEAGVANFSFLGWGTEFFDYDNDGDLDLYAVNGSTGGTTIESRIVRRRISSKLDQLYQNNGFGQFIEVSEKEKILGDESKSSAAFGDYNNDGFIDIFIVTDSFPDQLESSSRLYKNKPNGNRWLTIKLVGTKSNRDGVGTRITVKTAGKKQMREVISGSSFLGQNSLWQTFGLGKHRIIDEIEIRWPSGRIQTLHRIKTNQKITVQEE